MGEPAGRQLHYSRLPDRHLALMKEGRVFSGYKTTHDISRCVCIGIATAFAFGGITSSSNQIGHVDATAALGMQSHDINQDWLERRNMMQ